MLALLAAVGCRPQSTSPNSGGGERPLPSASPSVTPPSPAKSAPAQAATATRSANLVESSDAWVTREFQVQPKHSRVILVGVHERPATIRVPKLELNRLSKTSATEELSVDLHLDTLQKAADQAQAGDLIAVSPGGYAGFRLQGSRGGGQGKFIHFLALGDPGAVIVDRPGPVENTWTIALVDTHHIVLDGLQVVGQSQPGRPARNSPRAGIFIDGDFKRSGRMTHHIAIVRCHSHHHRDWGLHSTDTHHVLIQDSVFTHSANEHGCYVSDGSDDYVIRRNVFANNTAAGLQCNLDPASSIRELINHPKMKREVVRTRAWALETIRDGSRLFGAGQFPDGRGQRFIIESNVATRNGKKGGAAINLAALSDSVIQNNLIYNNQASGITQWDDRNVLDNDARESGPRTPSEFTGVEQLPYFGCRQNLIRHNTVLMSNEGRPAVQAKYGSWGSMVFNNILINDVGPGIEVDNTSVYQFQASHNIVSRVAYLNEAANMRSLATSVPETNAVLNVTLSQLLGELRAPSDQPWLTADGYAPHPKRPDFRPKPSTRLLISQGALTWQPPLDFTGQRRQQVVLGAFGL